MTETQWKLINKKFHEPYWFKAETGEKVAYRSKESFEDFLVRFAVGDYELVEDRAGNPREKTYTFRYVFPSLDGAEVGSVALHGFMIGAYRHISLSTILKGHDGGIELVASYVSDRQSGSAFKRICDSFKDYQQGEPLEMK